MGVLNKYGWLFIMIAMIGDIVVSLFLSFFYKGYSNTRMTISALGNPSSPVRLPFNIWMMPDIYGPHMPVFEKLLYDENDKVRMEAPEIFRVLGKRKPEYVRPYIDQLKKISETDSNRVVRIHSLGAIKSTETASDK